MTHQKILDTLDELMPEITSTRDPESVLLKFAKTNNLYPAQVQKLGHAFNQCKTLVGLQKQANRGDSFSLLDVPAMLEKYSTYDPAQVLSKKEKQIHKKVNNITKKASSNYTPFERLPMPDFIEQLKFKGAEIETNNVEEYDLSNSSGNFDITFSKSASEHTDQVLILKEAQHSLKEAISQASKTSQGAKELVAIKCASIAKVLRDNGPQAWAEIVEDSVYKYGPEKSAAAIDTIENYLEVNHIPFKVVDLTKKAYSNYLISDNYNMCETIKDIQELSCIYKEAKQAEEELTKEYDNVKARINAILEKEAATPGGSASNTPPKPNKVPITIQDEDNSQLIYPEDYENATKGLYAISTDVAKSVGGLPNAFVGQPLKAIDDFENYAGKFKRLLPDKDEYIKKYKKEQDKLDRELALQKLITGDPIIAEADPNEVLELYQTISSISPTFAKDHRMMATALKEALQYGAVPVSMLKDIADFEDKLGKARLNNSNIQLKNINY